MEGFKDRIDYIYYSFRNLKFSIKTKKLYSDIYYRLKQNEAFRNLYNGERCFILGNGPSNRDVDFSKLADEIVFTVNQCEKSEKFEDLKTNFHFWSDPIFYDETIGACITEEVIKSYTAIKTVDNDPICFVPLRALKFIKKNKIDEKIKVNYFNNCLYYYKGYNKEIDFTKNIPDCDTVVMIAIEAAIFMGFKEIYLLGIDSTGILNTVNSQLDKEIVDYSYKITKEEKERLNKAKKIYNMEEVFRGWTRVFFLYKELLNYCNQRNIKLVNCTQRTIVDSLPFEKLETVLSRKGFGQ